jgi:hypothetical protein
MTDEVKNNFSPSGESGSLVVIPHNYIEVGERFPICIRTIDDYGRAVYRGWIDAVEPVADTLRTIARTIMRDIWRVSELAEASVHSLSARCGEELGRCPQGRIYIDARWRAHDLAAGNRRRRVRLEVELPDHMLDDRADPQDHEELFVQRHLVEKVEQELISEGRIDSVEMMHLYLADCADEIPKVFGIPDGPEGYRAKNTLFQQFRREMRRVFGRVSSPTRKKAS